MADNNIDLKTIGDLFGMKFFIPSYQRGYRWTVQQVIDLLNDIEEFRNKISKLGNNGEITSDDFYCLQPLVVKRRDTNMLKEIKEHACTLDEVKNILKGSWEVIDGQQRLTTIFVILSVLEGNHYYDLSYETRNGNVSDWLKGKNKEDSIDYVHVIEAQKATESFFNNANVDKISFKKTLLENVKFIWYETIEGNPIRVFTRLNIGRISLTNAELIKALFLNQSNFPDEDANCLILKQREIASEWDEIEYSLQKDEFWLFLNEQGYSRPTRIDFIFDLICDHNKLNIDSGKLTHMASDSYKTFRYFYEYYKMNSFDITDCWKSVRKYFQTFQEWYNDLELYHYVGVLLSEDFLKKDRLLSNLVEKWTGNKTDFLNYLKDEISNEIRIPKGKCFCNENHIDNSLHFDSDKKLIRKILLLHNIQTIVIQNKQVTENEKFKLPAFYKFPFHHFKSEKWNVEHIDSNTTNDLSDSKQQKEWLLAAWIIASDELKSKISEFISTGSSEGFEALHDEILKDSGNSSNKLNESERMRIWNLALLDETTNKGYHNDIFSLKRKCLIGKNQGLIIDSTMKEENQSIIIEMTSTPAPISFIPICTMNAFLKYYTPTTNNLMDWDKRDAIEYRDNIIKTLQDFGLEELIDKNKANNEQ